ncbi:MAG: HlyC/CorC family transporter [Thermodesulfobacteria bacterium]|nr:HlyC/CorC family transporter [Thermodesulfobacteriota bacterium]
MALVSEDKPSLFKALKEIFGKSPEEEVEEFTEEITELLDEGEEKGLISPEEGEMIVNILQFRNVPVREVMVPRKDIVGIEINRPFEEIISLINRRPHTRYPAYEKDLDHLVGVIHVKELLRFCGQEDRVALRAVCREAYIVPETKKLRDLLREFRQRREQFALIIDESGVITGLVTLQDIFMEILGEDEPWFPRDQHGWYVAEGTVKLDDLEKFLRIKLPRGPYETLSGFIISQAGRIPEAGEHFQFDGLEVEILSADNRRIRKVRFRKLEDEES